MSRKKNITFDDIAKYTNFSKTTISRYFNNPDSLTLKNQEIIAQALIDLDYKENKVARILASGKTEFIGIVIPFLHNHYHLEMLTQILLTYEQFGYKFLVFIGNGDPGHRETVHRRTPGLQDRRTDHLKLHSSPPGSWPTLQIPIVTIEREDKYVSSVNTDNYMGGMQATSLLARHGCDILIHLNTRTSTDIPSHGRISGFLDLCEEKHLNHRVIYRDIGTEYEVMKKNMGEILDEIEAEYAGMKKGIFVSNDTNANVLLNLLIRKYGRLPDDYCIVGFDDSPISREAVLPISTVGQQIDKIAFEAVSLLVEEINERKKRRPSPPREPVHKVVTPVLLRRETTEH